MPDEPAIEVFAGPADWLEARSVRESGPCCARCIHFHRSQGSEEGGQCEAALVAYASCGSVHPHTWATRLCDSFDDGC